MARWKRPKETVEREVARCDFCGVEVESEDDTWYFATHRPCTLPGYRALEIITGFSGPYIVWGKTIGLVCASCVGQVDAYRADVARMVEEDGAVPHEHVWAMAPPLTPAQIAAVCRGEALQLRMPEGALLDEDQTPEPSAA
jgi:hypothetical protein